MSWYLFLLGFVIGAGLSGLITELIVSSKLIEKYMRALNEAIDYVNSCSPTELVVWDKNGEEYIKKLLIKKGRGEMFNSISKKESNEIKKNIKEGLDFWKGGNYHETIPFKHSKDLLIFETLLLITNQNEEMIGLLKKIENKMISPINVSE